MKSYGKKKSCLAPAGSLGNSFANSSSHRINRNRADRPFVFGQSKYHRVTIENAKVVANITESNIIRERHTKSEEVVGRKVDLHEGKLKVRTLLTGNEFSDFRPAKPRRSDPVDVYAVQNEHAKLLL